MDRSRLETRLERIPHVGIPLIIVVALCVSIGGVLGKKAYQLHGLNPMQAVGTSLMLVSVCQFTVLMARGESLKVYPGEGRWVASRCIFGAVTSLSAFLSFSLIPIGDATAIQSSAPVYVCLIAFVILRERPKAFHIIMVAINVVGVVFLSKATFIFSKRTKLDEQTVLGFVLANAVAISNAIVFVSLRKLKKTSTSLTVFWSSLTIFVTAYVVTSLTGTLKFPLASLPYILGIFVCLLLMQLLQTIALRTEKAALLSIVRTSQVFFSYVCQLVFFDEKLDIYATIGAAIIVTSVVGVAWDRLYQDAARVKQESEPTVSCKVTENRELECEVVACLNESVSRE